MNAQRQPMVSAIAPAISAENASPMLPYTPLTPSVRPTRGVFATSMAVPTGWYMAANAPISVSPAAISKGERASPVRIEAVPMPKKNTTIMPNRLQRSASQPDGIEKAPKAMKPPSDSGSSSA